MNRIVGKCYIIDSAGLWLTSNSAGNGDFLDFDFQTASLVSEGSGSVEITLQSNTASAVAFLLKNHPNTSFSSIDFPEGHDVEERMFVKTCVAGTAFLYFK